MISMKESPYEVGTDEVAAKLGLSSRSVRRLGEKGILEGKVETTSVGKQWFFSGESVESLIKAYEVKRQKEERHRTARDTFGNVPGQPQPTEDTTEVVRTPPLSDEKRVDALEDLLEKEQAAHSQTRGKLEKKEADLLEASNKAARLEGEKEAYEKYAGEMREYQQRLMGMLRETLRLQQPSTTDNLGHDAKDNRSRPRTAQVVSEVVSEPKQHLPDDEPEEAIHLTTSPQSPQIERHEDLETEVVNSPSSEEGTPPAQNYGEDKGVINTTPV